MQVLSFSGKLSEATYLCGLPDMMFFREMFHLSCCKRGEMAEWLKAHAWKACIPQGIQGSNPCLSATYSFSNVQQYSIACSSLTLMLGLVRLAVSSILWKPEPDGVFVGYLLSSWGRFPNRHQESFTELVPGHFASRLRTALTLLVPPVSDTVAM